MNCRGRGKRGHQQKDEFGGGKRVFLVARDRVQRNITKHSGEEQLADEDLRQTQTSTTHDPTGC